jgi:hypothetical protein
MAEIEVYKTRIKYFIDEILGCEGLKIIIEGEP